MKWSIKYIVSALPFLFTACSGDWLDLDPSTSVTSDNAIQSLEDAKTALNGIYRNPADAPAHHYLLRPRYVV